MDFHNRGRRFEEQIELLRKLWTSPVVNFEGRYHRVTAAGLNPMPVQRPIPVWIGASAEPALKRAAEMADGFFPQRPLEGGWPVTMDKMRGWMKAAGRDPARFGIEARVNANSGTPDDWHKVAEDWQALGATHARILLRELLPNVFLPLFAFFLLGVAVTIVVEGALSFLGLGVPPPISSWGSMIGEGRESLEMAPRLAFMPAITMFLTVLSFNLVGDTLRALTDPRQGAL